MRKNILGLLASVCVFLPASALAQERFISFGDSLTDTGNLFGFTGSNDPGPTIPPYSDGSFSNGITWVEHLNGTVERPLLGGSTAGNQDYAIAGAQTTGPTINGLNIGFIDTQIPDAIDRNEDSFNPTDTLSVWIGNNDMLNAVQATNANATTIANAAVASATNLSNGLNTILGAGATKILVWNIPDLGSTPLLTGRTPFLQGTVEEINAASQAGTFAANTYNTLVQQTIDTTQSAIGNGVQIVPVDVNAAFSAVLSNPSAFGFSNVTEGCIFVASCLNGTVEEQNQFLFFDTIHPTTAGHLLLANLASDYLGAAEADGIETNRRPHILGDALTLKQVATINTPLRDLTNIAASSTALVSRLSSFRKGENLAPQADDPSRLTIEASGIYVDQDRDGTKSPFDFASGGLRIGFVKQVHDNLSFVGGIGPQFGTISGIGFDADTVSGSLDLGVGYQTDRFFANLAGSFTYLNFDDIERQTNVPGIVHEGDTSGIGFGLAVQVGTVLQRSETLRLVPSVTLAYSHSSIDGYTETGAGAVLSYDDRDIDALLGRVALRAEYVNVLESGKTQLLWGTIAYEDYLSISDDGVGASLVLNPLVGFNVETEEVNGRGFVLDLGGKMKIGETMDFTLNGSGSVSVDGDYSIGGSGRISFPL